jgi:hypothetical protein
MNEFHTSHMSVEAEDTPDTSSRIIGWNWFWWLSVGLVIYVLSTGPIMMLADRNSTLANTKMYQAIAWVYAPLGWIVVKTPLRKPFGMYWHRWAPGTFDSKGDLKLFS